MQQDLEARQQRNAKDSGSDGAQRNLRTQAVQEMGKPGTRELAQLSPKTDRSSRAGLKAPGTELTEGEKQIQALIESGHKNVERLGTDADGVSNFKIKYPPNAEGKRTSIVLGLNTKGELAKIGNNLVEENGVWRKGPGGPEAKYQNNSFDSNTGRYTYQTGENEGRWIDPDGKSGKVSFDSLTGRRTYQTGKNTGEWVDLDGSKGKVNFNSNGSRAYYDSNGVHELTLRTDGSRFDPKKAKEDPQNAISGAAERFVNQPNGRAHIGTNGRHDYTIGKDGSRLDVASRTITRTLSDGRQEITYIDGGGKVTRGKPNSEGNPGPIESVGRSKYNQLKFEYGLDQKLTKATKVVEGKSEVVWNKRRQGAGEAAVSPDGILTIARADTPLTTTYDRQLVRRDFNPGETTPTRVVRANGEERRVADGRIMDTYSSHGKKVHRAIEGEQVSTHSKPIQPRRGERATDSRENLPAGTDKTIDEQGNLKLTTRNGEYQVRLASMSHITQTRQRRSR